MSIFTAPAILNTIGATADKGLKLSFITQELSDEEKVKAFRFFKSFGYLLFKESAVQESDIPPQDPTREDQKTPGQRLRAVLFVLYQRTCGHTDIAFDDFYRKEMEKIIESRKRLLED